MINSKHLTVGLSQKTCHFRVFAECIILYTASCEQLIGDNSKLTLFSAIPLSRFSLKMSRFFAYFVLKKMRFMCSAGREVELGRLSNPVLGKANSLLSAMSATISLQLTHRDINDSETVYFVIQEHHLIGSCIFL